MSNDDDIVLTEVKKRDSLTAWAHEVGIIMRDGKITDIFQEDRRSIPRKLFGGDEIRTFTAYTSPFDLMYWLNDPADPSEPDEGIALDNAILTSDGQPVTGSIGITFSIMPDMADLLLRLLGRRKTITRSDVANAAWGELQAKVLALDMHRYSASDLRGSHSPLRSIGDSLKTELDLTFAGYGLQIDSLYVNWGVTLEEKERVKQLRHRIRIQDAMREKELRDVSRSSPKHESTRDPDANAKTRTKPKRRTSSRKGLQRTVSTGSAEAYPDIFREVGIMNWDKPNTGRKARHLRISLPTLYWNRSSNGSPYFTAYKKDEASFPRLYWDRIPAQKKTDDNPRVITVVPKAGTETRAFSAFVFGTEEDDGGYVVNEDKPQNKALVHKSECRFFTARRPKRQQDGGWSRQYMTRDQAFAFAHATGRADVRGCGVCNP